MNNSEIRQEARYVLKGNWVNASLTLFLYGVLSSIGFIIALVVGGMFSALTSMGDLSRISSGSENLSPEDQMAVLGFYGKFMGAYAVGYILLFVGIGLFTLGLYKIFLGVARGEGANIGDLFKSCKYIFKVIGLMFMMGLFTYLWSLLFVIPGIIKGISYMMSFWILADDPDKGIMQCINESKQMMDGYKWKYFCLGFSFIGWLILACVVMIVPIVGFIAFYVAYFVVLAYMCVSQAIFYLDVSGQMGQTTMGIQYGQNYNNYETNNVMQNNMASNGYVTNSATQNNMMQDNMAQNNVVQNNIALDNVVNNQVNLDDYDELQIIDDEFK